MVKFSGTNSGSGGPVLGIGLSRENCERMLEGNPITFTTDSMAGLPALELLLFAGETDDEIAATMMGTGAVTPEQVREDKSLADPHIRPADSKGAN